MNLIRGLSVSQEELRLLGKDHPVEGSDPIGAREVMARCQRAAADLIVWLERKGRSADAEEIDDAVASLLEVAWAYDRGELQAWLPGDERAGPVEPLDQLVAAMRAAAGRLEDLDGEIPAVVWEGYDDA